MVNEPQLDPRPVDQVWPERKAALMSFSCSVGQHPVSREDVASWSEIERSEYYISGCCPTCFETLFPEDEEEE